MKRILTIVTLLSCLLMVSCAQRSLISESGLYHVALVEDLKSPVDGIWTWGKGNPYLHQKSGHIYIAPMDVRLAAREHPDMAPLMRPQMHDYMVQAFVEMLKDANKKNHSNWKLTNNPAEAQIRIDTALVHFEPQMPKMKVVGKVAGFMSPIPGVGQVIGRFAKGDITIEATIRDCKNGRLLMALKDSNRKPTRLFRADGYSKTGNADVNLQSWARLLAHICRAAWYDELGNTTLQEKFKDYTYAEALINYLKD